MHNVVGILVLGKKCGDKFRLVSDSFTKVYTQIHVNIKIKLLTKFNPKTSSVV